MNSSVRNKLSVMMFLEFFIWGAWLPLIFGYLPEMNWHVLDEIPVLHTLSLYLGGWVVSESSWVLNAFTLASLAALFFSTQFADRNFAAEKFVAFSHLIGGLSMIGLYFVRDFWPFFGLMLVHSLFYVPTISITNSIAFTHLKDAKRDFGLVRLWGTIGWIAASWPFIFILVDWDKVAQTQTSGFVDYIGTVLGTPKPEAARRAAVPFTFMTAGIASLLLAVFSLVLPHTPPKKAMTPGHKLAWLEAVKLLRYPFLFVLFVVTFIDSAVHDCYFVWTDSLLRGVGIPGNWVMPVMSIGQIAEVATMAALGYVLKNLGWKWTMILGVLGHTIRFGVFALAPDPILVVLVNVVHGICYAFFFATVYIFVDEFFPKDARSSAQGLFNFLILGAGPFVGNFVWPALGDAVLRPVPYERQSKESVLVKGALNSVLLDGTGPANGDVQVVFKYGGEGIPIHGEPEAITENVKANVNGKWTLGQQYIGRIGSEVAIRANGGAITEVKQFDYRELFLYPSGTALVAAILMLLFFHPPKKPPESEDEHREAIQAV